MQNSTVGLPFIILMNFLIIALGVIFFFKEFIQYKKTKKIFHKMYFIFFAVTTFLIFVHLLWMINIGTNWSRNSIFNIITCMIFVVGTVAAVYFLARALKLKELSENMIRKKPVFKKFYIMFPVTIIISLVLFFGYRFAVDNLLSPRIPWVPAEPVIEGSPHAWALAAGALLAERNGERHDVLGGYEHSEENVKKQKKVLSEWWGINNRRDLLKELKWLHQRGHRNSFEKMGEYCLSLTKEQTEGLIVKYRNNEEYINQIEVALKNYSGLGGKSLLGWDYGRYIALCRWGYLVGYLSEKEVWDKIMPVARLLQNTFSSWADLGMNYMIGREYWSYQETKRSGKYYTEAYERLLRDPNSPWNRNSWNTDLDRK